MPSRQRANAGLDQIPVTSSIIIRKGTPSRDPQVLIIAPLCGLILLISFVFDVKIPIFGAVVLAVVLSSPVSMLVLKPLRTRINHQAEAMDAHHASKRGLAKSRSVNLPDS